MNQAAMFRVLQSQGFTTENVEGFIKAMNENPESATKIDLMELKLEFKSDVSALKEELKKDIGSLNESVHKLETKLESSLKNMTWTFIGAITTIGAAMKAFDFYILHR